MTLFNFYKTKNINFIRFFAAAFIAMLFSSCVQDDDFQVPQDEGKSPNIEGTEVPLSAVVGQLNQSIADGDDTFTYEETDTYFSGYVVSSDEGGNFFEELVIQNNFENPTAGVRIAIDSSPLFGQFNFGRKVYVKLNGLTVGTDEGVATLGVQSGDRVEAIPESSLSETVIRDNITENIVPLEVSMGDFSDDLENLYISLSFVQFSRSSVLGDDVLTFASEPNDDFDGERVLESCNSGSTTVLSTSTFSDFKSLELPTQAGSLEAVLGRDFFDDMYILRVNKASDLVFDQERCDPDFLFCDGESGGPDTIYIEDFESVNSISQLTDWKNVQVEGNVDYILGNFDNSNYAQISGFQSGEAFTSWLVTEEIDLSTTTLEELSLDIQSNYDNGTILEIYITDDYTGDVTTTEWDLLDLTVPSGPVNGFGSFQSLGPINISCAGDNVRIGFKYEGEDPGPTTRYHIDNITIEGQN
ncbi:MAG: DUF5689 domain-containing protein [Psychroflexus sp.]|nr:DUF5689 domain-containing protein [Psychroflexus sp.]